MQACELLSFRLRRRDEPVAGRTFGHSVLDRGLSRVLAPGEVETQLFLNRNWRFSGGPSSPSSSALALAFFLGARTSLRIVGCRACFALSGCLVNCHRGL